MKTIVRNVLVCAVLAAAVSSGWGQAYQCAPNFPAGTKTIVVDAFQQPHSLPVTQYSNNDTVYVVVENINPLVAKYVIQAKGTAVAETAIATFLPFIGGVASSALDSGTAPAAPKAPPAAQPPSTGAAAQKKGPFAAKVQAPPPPAACQIPIEEFVSSRYSKLSSDYTKFVNALGGSATAAGGITGVTGIYVGYKVKYDDLNPSAAGATECKDIQKKITDLRDFLDGVKSPDEAYSAQIGQSAVTGSTPTSGLEDTLRGLTAEAIAVRNSITQYRLLTTGVPECENDLKTNREVLQKDEEWIASFVGPSVGTSKSDTIKARIAQLGTMYGSLSTARTSVDAIFDRSVDSNPFLLVSDKLAGPQMDYQVDVVKVAPASSGAAAPAKAAKPAGKKAAAPAADSATQTTLFTTELHFGYGARFNISGGLVVSTLPQRQYTTATNTVPNSTAANMIVYQNNSSTRLSPILLLNGRLFDCDPANTSCLWLPYLSFGITAKNDGKSTNAEYLIGPSWGLISRQLFLTVGAYAGQQQTLQGGLKVGDPTSLSSANLPITTGYHWNVGFAISWKIK